MRSTPETPRTPETPETPIIFSLPVHYSEGEHSVRFTYNASLKNQSVDDRSQKLRVEYQIKDLTIDEKPYPAITFLAKGVYGRAYLCHSDQAPNDDRVIKIISPANISPSNIPFYYHTKSYTGENIIRQQASEPQHGFCFTTNYAQSTSVKYHFITSDGEAQSIDLSACLDLVRSSKKYELWHQKMRHSPMPYTTTCIPTKLALLVYKEFCSQITTPPPLNSSAHTNTNVLTFLSQEKVAHQQLGTPLFISNIDIDASPDHDNKQIAALYFLIMPLYKYDPDSPELVSRQLFEEIISKKNHLSLSQLLTYIIASAAVLQEIVKKHRMVHGDLKPENLMVVKNSDGSFLIKPIDFGDAKRLGTPSRQIGTFCFYFAPETYDDDAQDITLHELSTRPRSYTMCLPPSHQRRLIDAIKNEKIVEATETSVNRDIYSMGILIWRCYAILAFHHRANLQHWVHHSFKDIEKIVLHCCEIDPRERPDYETLIQQLTQLRDTELAPAVTAATTLDRAVTATPVSRSGGGLPPPNAPAAPTLWQQKKRAAPEPGHPQKPVFVPLHVKSA